MDWHWFLFSFKGRINRAKCWFAVFVILDLMVLLALPIVVGGKLVFGVWTSLSFSFYDIFAVVDPQSIRAWRSASFVSLVFHAIATPLLLWVYAATAIKRLHDRDRSGWWLVPFFVVPGLYGQFEDRLGDSYAVIAIDIIATVFTIWGLIELYCLKGTRETNRFGPNPLPTGDDKSDGGAAPAGYPKPQRHCHFGAAPGLPTHSAIVPAWHVAVINAPALLREVTIAAAGEVGHGPIIPATIS